MSPLEQACRELCAEAGLPETEWRLWEKTLVGGARALGIACRGFGAAFRAAYPPRRLIWMLPVCYAAIVAGLMLIGVDVTK